MGYFKTLVFCYKWEIHFAGYWVYLRLTMLLWMGMSSANHQPTEVFDGSWGLRRNFDEFDQPLKNMETRDSNWWFKLVQIRDVDFNKKTTNMWTSKAKMWIWRTAYGDAGSLCDQVAVGPTSQAWDTTGFVSKHPGDHIFCCCLSCLSSKWSNFNRYRNAVILENLGWSTLYPSPTLLRAAPSWEIIEANGGFSSKPCLITRGEPSLWGHNGDIMQT